MKNVQIAMRLDESQLAMLDAKIELLRVEVPGVTWERSSALKYLAMMMAKPVAIEPAVITFGGDTTTMPAFGQVTYT